MNGSLGADGKTRERGWAQGEGVTAVSLGDDGERISEADGLVRKEP